jgi:hypothetical protein
VSGFYFGNEWFKCQSAGGNLAFSLSVKEADIMALSRDSCLYPNFPYNAYIQLNRLFEKREYLDKILRKDDEVTESCIQSSSIGFSIHCMKLT